MKEVGEQLRVEYAKELNQHGPTSPFLDFEYYTNWRDYSWTDKASTVEVGEGLFRMRKVAIDTLMRFGMRTIVWKLYLFEVTLISTKRCALSTTKRSARFSRRLLAIILVLILCILTKSCIAEQLYYLNSAGQSNAS